MEKKLKEIHMGFIFSNFFPRQILLPSLFYSVPQTILSSLSCIPATFNTDLRVASLSPSLP